MVHAEEYALAKRKKAREELHRTREKNLKERALAEAQSARKIKEGELIKKEAIKRASNTEAAALRDAKNSKRVATRNKSAAQAKAKRDKAIALKNKNDRIKNANACLLYTSPSPRDATLSRMPSSA